MDVVNVVVAVVVDIVVDVVVDVLVAIVALKRLVWPIGPIVDAFKVRSCIKSRMNGDKSRTDVKFIEFR